MGFLSALKRKLASPAKQGDAPGDDVERARTRARQRLIGAVVLVGIGIIGFPLLFETHPRPIPVDIPIEIANKKDAPPLTLPPPRPPAAASSRAPNSSALPPSTSPEVITESAADAGRELAAPAPSSTASTTATTPAARAPDGAVERAAERPAERPTTATKPPASTSPTDAARARALLNGKDSTTVATASPAAAAKPDNAASAGARFVVQVGAFAESKTASDTRQKVEKLGFKTYTQVVDTAGGSRTRVRVGPFATREEADRAAGKLKAAGLGAALLSL